MNEMSKYEREKPVQPELTPFQRQQQMLAYINRHKSASVKQLARTFYLHEATVRRDLNTLARAGQLNRIRGGAAAMEGLQAEIPLYVRETAFREVKRELARKAAALVKDGNTIFIDSSSTATMMTPFLENRKNLRIVTDGAQTSLQLAKLKDAQVFCVGGCLRGNSLSYIGPIALQNLAMFHFDYAFFSCRSASLENGLSDITEEEAFFRKLLIQRSENSVVLMDHSKIGETSFFGIAPLNAIDIFVTDADLSSEWHAVGIKIL